MEAAKNRPGDDAGSLPWSRRRQVAFAIWGLHLEAPVRSTVVVAEVLVVRAGLRLFAPHHPPASCPFPAQPPFLRLTAGDSIDLTLFTK